MTTSPLARPTALLRHVGIGALSLTFLCGGATSAAAQDQSVSFSGGYFALRGADARIANDVLFENQSFLSFDIKDFNFVYVGGEYHVGIGPLLEAGLGMGFYRRTVPTVYSDYVDSNGREIEQDLRLRIIPVTAIIRFMPLGRGIGIEPYVGGGIGLFRWRYSEVGDFVDFTDQSVFTEVFVAEGLDAGPILLGGVRGSFNRQWGVGGEIRYQRVRGALDAGFLTDRIDLGGITAQGARARSLLG